VISGFDPIAALFLCFTVDAVGTLPLYEGNIYYIGAVILREFIMSSNNLERLNVTRRGLLGKALTASVAVGTSLALFPKQASAREKAELIDSIASEADITKADAKKALDAFIDTTTKALKKGNRVALVGFGSFSVSKRSARKGRNPQTGKEIKIPAKKVVQFKAGDELAAALDLIPGEGDERRLQAGTHIGRRGMREVDHKPDTDRSDHWVDNQGQGPLVTIDAEVLARQYEELSKADAKKAINAFIVVTADKIKKKKRATLAGFGAFSVSKRSARKGRNPQTGKEIKIPAKKVVKFKPGAELSEKIK
jgi:DNA-binding protein HU-beta